MYIIFWSYFIIILIYTFQLNNLGSRLMVVNEPQTSKNSVLVIVSVLLIR